MCGSYGRWSTNSNPKQRRWKNNTIWGVFNSVDGTDKKEIATEENMGFTDENIFKAMDLNAENGGVNFTATGTISSTIGDPRWKN